jgi:signal transduction histidine kinase
VKISPAVRVAAGATAVIAVVYIICVTVLNLVVSAHLAEQEDESLAARLTSARQDPALLGRPVARSAVTRKSDIDDDAAPVFLWSLSVRGAITAHSPGAPVLPSGLLAGPALRDGQAVTVRPHGPGSFRLKMSRDGSGWLVAGQSVAGYAHTERLLLNGEIIAGPFLLLAMFFGSLVVGLRALAPVEQSRRRQLEFTADASHELRTPLSVIRAEADVALSAPREAAQYRDVLGRIQGESQRLRQLVDDMLWLARFDSRPPPPGDEPVDLGTLAQACADRFRAVGPAISVATGPEPALIAAGMDRPAGRGPDGQRLPVRGRGWPGPDPDRCPGQPGQPHRAGQRVRHSRGRSAAAVRPVPPLHRTQFGGRPRAGHRRLDCPLDRRTLARRRLTAGRGAHVRILAPLPAAFIKRLPYCG